jgi:hypothetical protein
MAIEHTDPTLVSNHRTTLVVPRSPSSTGYGRKIPTRYMLDYNGRAHRVYTMIYGNSGSVYILSKGKELFLDIDTEYALQDGIPPQKGWS